MKKLYALLTNKEKGHGYGEIVIQVSFNKEELEEIADYLNHAPAVGSFSPHARVAEVDSYICEFCWPAKKP